MVVCKPRCLSSGKALTASRAYYDGMSKDAWASGYTKKEMKPVMQNSNPKLVLGQTAKGAEEEEEAVRGGHNKG